MLIPTEQENGTFKFAGKRHLFGKWRVKTLDEIDSLISLIDELIVFLQDRDVSIILLTPTPRHFDRCCEHLKHFIYDFDGLSFVKLIRELNLFLSKTQRWSRLPHPPHIPVLDSMLGGKIWSGNFVAIDGVHLTQQGYMSYAESIEQMGRELGAEIHCSYTTKASIPGEMSFREWSANLNHLNPEQPCISCPSCLGPGVTPPFSHPKANKQSHGKKYVNRSHPYSRC